MRRKFLVLFLTSLTQISMAAAPRDIKPVCSNEAYEVNGERHLVLQIYYSSYGDEALGDFAWIESLKSIPACTSVVTKADSKFKRLEAFARESQNFTDPYKKYFTHRVTVVPSKIDQLSKAKILQQDIDKLVNEQGISVTEACAVEYGQWSWAAINSTVIFTNRMNSDWAECKNTPLNVIHPPKIKKGLRERRVGNLPTR
jgi:hypothetical protein